MSPSPPSSQSRSRSREPIHAAGRGGLGNIHAGGPSEKIIEEQDESERASHLHAPGVYVFYLSFSNVGPPDTEFYYVSFSRHSSGRGGTGNLTAGEIPHREGVINPHGANHPHNSHDHSTESFGRGGSGNISRDHSREPGVRETHHKPLSGLMHSVTAGLTKG
jgi:hypothetical protein